MWTLGKYEPNSTEEATWYACRVEFLENIWLGVIWIQLIVYFRFQKLKIGKDFFKPCPQHYVL